MLVLVLVVLVWVGFSRLSLGDVPDPVKPVDVGPAADYAREQAAFGLLAPSPLPSGWVATSVRFRDSEERRGQSWHLGMLTEEERYVGLEQADRSPDSMVEEHVDEGAVAGDPVEVDGETWASYTDAGGDLALVRRAGGSTVLVVGPVSAEVLTTLLKTLA